MNNCQPDGISSLSIYSMAVLQIPLMFFVSTGYPQVRADIFSTSARVINNPLTNDTTTAIDLLHPTELHYMHSIGVSSVFLLCSSLYAGFVVITIHMRDKGLNGDTQDIGFSDYVSSNVEISTHPTVTMWNNVFLASIVVSHSLVAAIACSPTSLHLLMMITLLLYVSIGFIIQPKLHVEDTSNSGATGLISSQYMLYTGAYVVAMLYTCTNIPQDPGSFKVQMVGVLLIVDVFLLILGHTWDPSPNMQTIINCRLAYMMLMIPFNVLIYTIWDPYLRCTYINNPL